MRVLLRDAARVFSGLVVGPGSIAGKGSHDLPAFSLRDLASGRLSTAHLDRVRVEHPEKARRYQTRPGDVLLAARGTQVKAGIVPEGAEPAVITASLIGVRPNEGRLRGEVLLAYLQSPEGSAEIGARARSSTGQIALTRADVERIEVPIPSLAVQDEIAAIVREINEYEAGAEKAVQLRRDIAQRAMFDLIRSA